MKVAIISSGDPKNMKGVMNFVQEKLEHLKKYAPNDITIDAYLIQTEETWFFKVINSIRNKKIYTRFITREHSPLTNIGNISYHNLWVKYGVIDNLYTTKFKKKLLNDHDIYRFLPLFCEYDIVSSHNLNSHYLALKIHEFYNIPFITTWHGSDINCIPFQKHWLFSLTKKVIETSYMNFFVSKKLLASAQRITQYGIKDILYTGVADAFIKLSEEDRILQKKRHKLYGYKTIAFVGNLYPIKNVQTLPNIFLQIKQQINSCKFIIIGDGDQEQSLKQKLKQKDIEVSFIGRVPPTEMPLWMNCIDVIILPSLNEGLPLVTLEALSCGCHVVASNVGGIPEVIERKNCFDLDTNFCQNVAQRVIEILQSNEKAQPLDNKFSWENAIHKEINTYRASVKR